MGKILREIPLQLKLGVSLVAGFVIFTVLGTVTHELGHFISARLLGYNVSINYGFTFYNGMVNPLDSFIITLGGPLQTMLTGTIGCFIVWVNRNEYFKAGRLRPVQWLVIFFALFWLREVFNFFHAVGTYMKEGSFPEGSDEVQLALKVGMNSLIIITTTAFAGISVLAYLVFKIIPLQQRLTFIFAGLTGGFLGYYIWFHWLGPVLMP